MVGTDSEVLVNGFEDPGDAVGGLGNDVSVLGSGFEGLESDGYGLGNDFWAWETVSRWWWAMPGRGCASGPPGGAAAVPRRA